MPSLASILSAQLGLGSLPLAASKAAVPGHVSIEAEKARQEAQVNEQRQRLFNTKPPLLTTQGRRAMRLEKGKEASKPLPSSPSLSPSEPAQSSKDSVMPFAPVWEKGMEIVRKVRASGDLALVSQLNAQMRAVESGNPDIAVPAALALQQWYKNSPFAVSDMTKGTVAKVPQKKKKEVSDEP